MTVYMLAVNPAWEMGRGGFRGRGAYLLDATRKECFISNQRRGLFLLTSFGVAPFTGATPFP